MRISLVLTMALAGALASEPSQAADQGSFGKVIRIPREAFTPDAGRITFSEKPLRSRNPFYNPPDYGAGASGVKVTFGGYFVGQNMATRAQCPRGAGLTGCLAGTPRAPLRLAGVSPATFITSDRANPTSPSLSGSPQFNGPVSILFDKDIAGVGLAGGYFNAKKSTAIQAFDRDGRLIGGVKNIGLGMEYMALVTEDGRNRIAGLQFSLVGPEPAGYAIDDLVFAFAGQLDREQIGSIGAALKSPEPAEPEVKNADTPEPEPKPKTGSLKDLFAKPDPAAPSAPAAKPEEKRKKTGSLTDLFAD